jgi:hypothetical protein
MEVIKESEDRMLISLDENDIESAIRQFICNCNPDLSVGYCINPIEFDDKNKGYTITKNEFEAVKE